VAAEPELHALLTFAEQSDEVLGLYLFGSRGRGLFVDDRSDWDVWVVLRDDAARARFDERFPYLHGARVEVASSTLAGLREHGTIGSPSEWSRYHHAHVDVRIDKTGGELLRILEAKESIPAEHRDEVVRESLGAYANSTYRALRYGTRLDAVESVAPALRTIFALEGRVRPFNKYLEWELREHPLAGWDADELLSLVTGVLEGDAAAQHELFRRIGAAAARTAGFEDAIDEWEPDLAWLRGEAEYRPRD
jgi:predicted nucleotidyltransferase